jgi:hypothetical protein
VVDAGGGFVLWLFNLWGGNLGRISDTKVTVFKNQRQETKTAKVCELCELRCELDVGI